MQGPAERGSVEEAAVLGLGRRRTDARAVEIRGIRRASPAPTARPARRHAGARGAHSVGCGMLSLPADQGGARPWWLGRSGYLRPLMAMAWALITTAGKRRRIA